MRDDQKREAPMSAAMRATKPVAMTGLPALFVEPAVAEVVADADAEATLVVMDWVAVAAVAVPTEVGPPMGAVDWPLISA